MRSRSKFVALALATHLPQTLAMVGVAAIGASLLGVSGAQILLVALAVLSGQVSVGWSNDYIDAKVDKQLARADKPVVRDQLDPQILRLPIIVALILVVPLSFAAAGFIGGSAHLLAVASAWAYNLFLSRTVWSWVPYTVSFSLLMVFLAQAASTTFWPTPLFLLLASLVGVVAHLLNALPDIDRDVASGVGGLAVSLGRRGSWALTGGLALLTIFVLWLALSSPVFIGGPSSS
jgi:4-hydroxybenzoate polyprenyltransferase